MRSAEGVFAGALGGAIAGAATGIGARVAMRLVANGVADGVGITPEFTVAGSLAVVLAGAIIGTPPGIVFALLEPRLPVPARMRGLTYGLLLLAIVGPLFLTTEEFFSVGRVALFTLLFPVYGIVAGIFLPRGRRLAARLPRPLSVAR